MFFIPTGFVILSCFVVFQPTSTNAKTRVPVIGVHVSMCLSCFLRVHSYSQSESGLLHTGCQV